VGDDQHRLALPLQLEDDWLQPLNYILIN
jgi:hypothetical protein